MSRLLTPTILMALRNLQLAARTTVDGFMSGINKSTVKEPGMEFSQYRSYQPGDDLRWLDWKMYGRSDRYYIRESEIETSISVRILLDGTSSMNHPDDEFQKIDFGRLLAASISWLAHQQGDATGLCIFTDRDLVNLPCRRDHQHIANIFFQLDKFTTSGSFHDPELFTKIFSDSQKKELVIVISDLYDEDESLIKFLSNLAALKHEVIVFHLVSRNELELDYANYTALEDLETGKRIQFNGTQQKADYQNALNNHLASVRMKLLNRGIYYRLLNTGIPIAEALRDFLKQRNKLKI